LVRKKNVNHGTKKERRNVGGKVGEGEGGVAREEDPRL